MVLFSQHDVTISRLLTSFFLKSKSFLHLSIKCSYHLKKVCVSPIFIINVDNPLEEPFSIEWAKYDKEAKYLSLFQNIAFSTNLPAQKA